MSDDNTNKQPPNKNNSPLKKTPPVAMIIWMLVFLAAISLFVFSMQQKQVRMIDQSSFENMLSQGKIESVTLTPQSGDIMLAQGKLKASSHLPSDIATYQSRIIYTNSLDKLLRDEASGQYKVSVTVQNDDTWIKGMLFTFLIIVVPLILIYFLFARQLKSAGKGAMQFGKSKARMISPDKNKIKFGDVAGADEAKEETKEIMDYLRDPLKYKLLGAKIPKGAMLVGPPGTGKTLMAKAIAGEAHVPFFAISGSDFVEMFVGVGASRVRDMFELARKHAPSLIFIDEIDAVGRSRFSGIGGGHDEREQTLNAMLVEMDGLETQEGAVIVLAATNRPDVLDPALVRPGRFDRQIVMDFPDIKGRRQILEVHAKNIKTDETVDLDIIARGTPGFSGADLANLINEAALLAARYNKKAASIHDIEEARDKVCFGVARKSRVYNDAVKKLTAYHEAGHALVNLYCSKSIPLHKVTIIPRGMALGITMQMDDEDRYSQTMSEMKDVMAMTMGGRCAEEITFGKENITSGASNDIQQVTKIAKSMVCVYGMSEKMGTLSYGSREQQVFVGRDITRSEDYSEATARELDLEVKILVDTANKKAMKILLDHKDELKKLGEALLVKETMTGNEIRELLGMPPRVAAQIDYSDIEGSLVQKEAAKESVTETLSDKEAVSAEKTIDDNSEKLS